MPVYEYKASAKDREEHTESGKVVARDEADARAKLKPLQFERIKLKRLSGLDAFFSKFTADIK